MCQPILYRHFRLLQYFPVFNSKYRSEGEHWLKLDLNPLTLFRTGIFRAVHGWEGGGAKMPSIPKICHTHPTMMKLGSVRPYLKKIQKCMNHVTHPLSSTDIRIFLPEVSKFCYNKKYRYRLHFGT